jgi:pimeloyl-ACP methyl ester carboxylesterase
MQKSITSSDNFNARRRNFIKGAAVSASALFVSSSSKAYALGGDMVSDDLGDSQEGSNGTVYTAITAPTRLVEARGIRFAYRRWGKPGTLPLVFNQHFNGNLDNWDPAVLDGLAAEREIIIFNNAGVASSSGEVPRTFAGMATNAEAFIDALGLKQIDLLGFSIGGMVAQQIVVDRPELVRRLILVGTAPRNLDAGNGQGHITPETAAVFGASYNPPENLWLKVFFTDSDESQAAGRAFLKRYLSRTQNPDAPVSDKVAPAQIAAVGNWVTLPGERFAYLRSIKQPTLIVSGNHDVIVYTVNSLYLVQNLPNAKLILYPDANHGSWYQYHDEFVFEANKFLNS